jgi:hypothetical protein
MMRKFILVLFISNAVNYANGQIRYDNGGLHDGSGNGIGEYAIQGNSWSKRFITYYFQNTTNDFNQVAARESVRSAMRTWEAV